MKYRAKFTPTATVEYDRLLNEARIEIQADPGPAVTRVLDVNATVRLLQTLDPDSDTPLLGYFWWINCFTNGDVQMYYARHVAERSLTVLYFNALGSDPAGTYALFVHLVLSGRFDSVMAKYGVTMPTVLPASGVRKHIVN